MDGRFRKVHVPQYSFVGGGGIYCNKEHHDLLYRIMRHVWGKPNGNSLRNEESTWMYVVEYMGVFLTIYDYGDNWSLGFLELDDSVPDYELIFAFSRMLYNYLSQTLESQLSVAKEPVLV